jgi:hypothetical protein
MRRPATGFAAGAVLSITLLARETHAGPAAASGPAKAIEGVAGDLCTSAIPLALDRPLEGATVGGDDYVLPTSACFTGIGQAASTAQGRDLVYAFVAPGAGRYSFKISGYTGGNPILYVASSCPTGPTPIAVDSCMAASNRNPLTAEASEEVACLSLTAGQSVHAFVDEAALTPGGSFRIEVNACLQEVEANGTPATANPLVPGLEGGVVPATDADFFSLSVPAGGGRLFAMVDGSAGSSADFDLRVTTATNTLEYDDMDNVSRFGFLAPNVSGTPVPAGAVFLRVSQFFPTEQSEPYRLYAVVQPVPNFAALETEPNQTLATASFAPANYFQGALPGPAPSIDVDLYRFPAEEGDLVFLGLDGDPTRDATPVNAQMALLDASGNVLVSVNDERAESNTANGNGSLSALQPHSPGEALVYRVPTGGTGDYFARVSIGTTAADSSGAGNYLLSISRNGFIGGGLPVELQGFVVE